MEKWTYLNNNHLVKFLNRKDGKDTKFQCVPAWHLQAVMSWFCSAQPAQPRFTHPAGSCCVCCQALSISLPCLPGCSSVCVSTDLPWARLEKLRCPLCLLHAQAPALIQTAQSKGLESHLCPESLLRLHWLSTSGLRSVASVFSAVRQSRVIKDGAGPARHWYEGN